MKKILSFVILFLMLFNPTFFQAKEDYNEISQLEDGVLTVGTNCEYAPYEYVVTEEQKTDTSIPLKGTNTYCDGYDMIWLNKIADELNIEVELVTMDFGGLIPALNSGSIDLIAAAMSPTPERREELDFTNKYYSENLVMSIVTLKDGKYADAKNTEDFNGATISSALGTSNEKILNTMEGVNKYKSLEGVSTLINSTTSGLIDGYLTDHDAAEQEVASNDKLMYVDLNDLYLDPGYTGYAMAAQKDSDDLIQLLNTVIDNVNEDEKNVMMEKAIKNNKKVNGEEEKGFLGSSWDLFVKNRSVYFSGILVTLELAIFGTFFGIIFAFILVLMRIQEVHYKDKLLIKIIKKTVNIIAVTYIAIIRGTPMMVQAMVFFYGIASDFLQPNTAGMIVISFNTAAYVAEILRSGINSMDKGQQEAGRSLGLSNTQVFLNIVIPQTLKNTLPALANQLVLNVKDSSVLSVIAVSELYYSTKQLAASGYEYGEAYFIVAVIYLILTIVLTKLLSLIIKRKVDVDNVSDVMTLQNIEEGV